MREHGKHSSTEEHTVFTRNLEEAKRTAAAARETRGIEWGRLGRIRETMYGARVVRMLGRDRNGSPLYRVDRFIVTTDPLFDMALPSGRWADKAVAWESEHADEYGNPVLF